MAGAAAKNVRIALTGGIACGKSLVAHFLNASGVETLDADDVVHGIFPDPAERRRMAAEVFADPAKRRALEAKVHPIVRERLEDFLTGAAGVRRVVIVPLLFEVHWEGDFDVVACVASERHLQIERMMKTRGYSQTEAEARLAAQMPVAEKARRSQYVIRNNGTADALRMETQRFVRWLDVL